LTPLSLRQALQGLLTRGSEASERAGAAAEYTVVYPPTMLWANFQRPHNVLTHLARHHEVRCLFNDWTVAWDEYEDGSLIVTRRAFRARYHRGPFVYYFSIPEKLDYLRRHRLRPDLLVFELMDLPEEEFRGWKEKLPEAIARADIVRTTNPRITEYLREHFVEALGDKEVRTSHNGVDLERFDPTRTHEKPPEFASVRKPILGFYGNLDWWIDWELMRRLSELTEYQVVVIGDTEGRRDKIPADLQRSSIMWLGRRPIEMLPDYLDCFDVALFPFVVNEMTDAVDPLKVWEYLAFGKPVLATSTAFVRSHPELFHIVDRGDPAQAVLKALAAAREETLVLAWRAAAAERDWRYVADDFHAQIREQLGERGG
jgi:glycosyltransferase involved in cell wall biosynthesis